MVFGIGKKGKEDKPEFVPNDQEREIANKYVVDMSVAFRDFQATILSNPEVPEARRSQLVDWVISRRRAEMGKAGLERHS